MTDEIDRNAIGGGGVRREAGPPPDAGARGEAGPRPDSETRRERGGPRRPSRFKRLLLILLAIVVAFGAGFVWQYMRAESLEEELAEARREVTFTGLEATLAAATFQVFRGAYEQARQLTSDFYTGLQENVDAAPVAARTELRVILDERDRMITLLSRAEPESRDALMALYMRYRAVTRGPGPTDAGASPGREPEDTTPGRAAASTPGRSAPLTPGRSEAPIIRGAIGLALS